jgi:hypothetical protein
LTPLLNIKMFGYAIEEVCELEQARYIFFYKDKMVLIEGQKVNTFAELVEFANQEKYRGRESLEVVLIPAVVGG